MNPEARRGQLIKSFSSYARAAHVQVKINVSQRKVWAAIIVTRLCAFPGVTGKTMVNTVFEKNIECTVTSIEVINAICATTTVLGSSDTLHRKMQNCVLKKYFVN